MSRQDMPMISYVVTTLNALDLTKRALKSIYDTQHKKCRYEVIVVDNNSHKETKNFLLSLRNRSDTQVIFNPTNYGYGKACNIGAKASEGDILCFFSNDVQATNKQWIIEAIRLIQEPHIGLVGCKLRYNLDHPKHQYRGTIQHAGCEIKIGKYMDVYPSVINQHVYRYADSTDVEVNKQKKVDMVTAACFFIRKNVFDELNGFDPIFGLGYCEDLDLNLRIRKKEYEIWYCPSAELYHYEMIGLKTVGTKKYRQQRTHNQLVINKRWLEYVKEEKHKYEE